MAEIRAEAAADIAKERGTILPYYDCARTPLRLVARLHRELFLRPKWCHFAQHLVIPSTPYYTMPVYE